MYPAKFNLSNTPLSRPHKPCCKLELVPLYCSLQPLQYMCAASTRHVTARESPRAREQATVAGYVVLLCEAVFSCIHPEMILCMSGTPCKCVHAGYIQRQPTLQNDDIERVNGGGRAKFFYHIRRGLLRVISTSTDHFRDAFLSPRHSRNRSMSTGIFLEKSKEAEN